MGTPSQELEYLLTRMSGGDTIFRLAIEMLLAKEPVAYILHYQMRADALLSANPVKSILGA